MNNEISTKNPLGEKPVNSLLYQFAVPSIIAMLVSSLYNIVDQFFIGRSVGALGNAATNISFPLSISCVAIALLFGIGGASAFNIAMGMDEKENAVNYLANSAAMLFLGGVALTAVTLIFLEPLLKFFGSPDNVLEYAKVYTSIVALGFPFLIFTSGGGHLIRADGRPKISMVCNLAGALINTVLDALFVFVLNMGMAGAAYATIIGQIVSGLMAAWYLAHCRTIKIKKENLRVRWKYISRVMSLGTAPCANQLAMMVVQIVMNKSLKYYGSLSVYGESIPIACAGIITKVNQVFMAICIGISQGSQPIWGFNYGAKKYDRVRQAYCYSVTACTVIATIFFLCFQLFPHQIVGIFGTGSYLKIFMFMTFANGIQPMSSGFFTSIGKAKLGIVMSLTRQVIFLLPLIVIFPLFMGIDGVMYAGPIADAAAFVLAIVFARRELAKMRGVEA